MFSAWNLSEWISSIAVTMGVFGLVAAVSTLLGYISIKVWGEEMRVMVESGLPKAKTETKSPVRTAA